MKKKTIRNARIDERLDTDETEMDSPDSDAPAAADVFMDWKPEWNDAIFSDDIGEDQLGPLQDDFVMDWGPGEENASNPVKFESDDDEVVWMGPAQGSLRDMVCIPGGMVAVGDGVFRMAADGMLHPVTDGFDTPATGICQWAGHVILATADCRLFDYDPRNHSLKPVFGWRRFQSGDACGVATSRCRVISAEGTTSPCLLVRTGQGHLFCRDWQADSFRSVLTDQRVMAISAISGRCGEWLLLCRSREGSRLVQTSDFCQFETVGGFFPSGLNPDWTTDAVIDAAHRTMVVSCALSGMGMEISLDGGRTFGRSGCQQVSAVRVHPEEPMTIVSGVYYAAEDRSSVQISRDGGHIFDLLFSIRGRVHRLLWDSDGTSLWVVSDSGGYQFQRRFCRQLQ